MSNQSIQHSEQLSSLAFCIPCTDSVQNTFKTLASYAAPVAGGKLFQCFPKITTIAAAAGMSDRSIKYHLKQLVAVGVVNIKHRYRVCKKTNQARRISSLYSINVVRLKQLLHKLKVRIPVCTNTLHRNNSSSRANKNNASSTFLKARFEQANAEHDHVLAAATANKVSNERGLELIRKLKRDILKK